jgi:hypothetical protein
LLFPQSLRVEEQLFLEQGHILGETSCDPHLIQAQLLPGLVESSKDIYRLLWVSGWFLGKPLDRAGLLTETCFFDSRKNCVTCRNKWGLALFR